MGDVAWSERRTLYGTGPAERVYSLATDEQGRVLVSFGDGVRGARLPTGPSNVRAFYRKGIGAAGNVTADSLTQLVSRPLGLKSVSNPLAAEGGTDPEAAEAARGTIPLTTRTLERAVSLLDYEDFARAFAGIAKVQAALLALRGGTTIAITVAADGGKAIGTASPIWQNLLAALAANGDPHVAVMLLPLLQSTFRLGLRVKRDPAYGAKTVLAAVEAALRKRFRLRCACDRRAGLPVGRDRRGASGARCRRPRPDAALRRHPTRGPDHAVAAGSPAGAAHVGRQQRRPAGRAADPRPRPARAAGGDAMSTLTPERLYDLLPAVHRLRDADRGEPLRALIGALAREFAALEENVEQLYDDLFIETCADWVAPYIGDLIGYRPLYGAAPKVASPRAEVADTIAHRRRKGTALMLEQLASDVTGWPAHAVEYFELLATAQYMKHRRLDANATADLRDLRGAWQEGGGFTRYAHTAEMRGPERAGGRYNIRNIGIFLWRLAPFRLTLVPLTPDAGDASGRRFRFNPLGADLRLFRRPLTEDYISHLAEPANVPEPLAVRRVALDRPLDYGDGRSFALYRPGDPPAPITPDAVRICDLRDVAGGWNHEGRVAAGTIAVDPERGRVLLGRRRATGRCSPPSITARWGRSAAASISASPREGTWRCSARSRVARSSRNSTRSAAAGGSSSARAGASTRRPPSMSTARPTRTCQAWKWWSPPATRRGR